MSSPEKTTHLLYLHGFRSSPQSAKARLMAAHIAQHHPQVTWHCPQLAPSPQQAMHEVAQAIADWPSTHMAVVGSSLGGFYATWVAQRQDCRAVLLNPATHPARDLEKYIGSQTQFHAPEESFYFLPEYIQELRALETGALQAPEKFLAVIAKGDEVLDWHEMAERYQASQCLLLEGADHALSHFERLLPTVLEHLDLA
jgi:predicted esterase YcpF (UPF0227 family)